MESTSKSALTTPPCPSLPRQKRQIPIGAQSFEVQFGASLGIVSRLIPSRQPLGSKERPCESCLTLGAVQHLLPVPGLVLLSILRTHLLENMQLPSGRSFISCVTLSVKSQTSTNRGRLLLGPATGPTPRYLAPPMTAVSSVLVIWATTQPRTETHSSSDTIQRIEQTNVYSQLL